MYLHWRTCGDACFHLSQLLMREKQWEAALLGCADAQDHYQKSSSALLAESEADPSIGRGECGQLFIYYARSPAPFVWCLREGLDGPSKAV